MQTFKITTKGALLLAAALSLSTFLGSCSIGKLLGLSPTQAIQGFSITAAKNPGIITSAINATISGSDIYLTIPYSLYQSETPVTPTLTLAPGFELKPAAPFSLTNGMNISAVKSSNNQVDAYTLHLAITPQSAPNPTAFSAISSFIEKAALNASLSSDAAAIVSGTDIYLTLPYAVVAGKTALTPTVTAVSGYSLVSPTGSYVPTDGLILAVKNDSTGENYNYTLHVNATPNQLYAGSASLVNSFVVTSALNPSLSTNATALVNGSNIYITLPSAVVQAGTLLTPTVSLAPGYTISPAASYAFTDGMHLVLTQTATAAITDYTLHVGSNAASLAFLKLASPFYYDAGGTKVTLSPSEYALGFDSNTNTYTLTLNTDSFASFAPYYASQTQTILSRNIGFSTVETPYNASVTGASSAIGGAAAPYTITVRSADGTSTDTYTVNVVRTKSSWIGASSANGTASYAYGYTDSTSGMDSGWYNSWMNSGPITFTSPAGVYTTSNSTTPSTVFFCSTCYGYTNLGYTNYTNPSNSISVSNTNGLNLGSGSIASTPHTLSVSTSLLVPLSATYSAISATGWGTVGEPYSIGGTSYEWAGQLQQYHYSLSGTAQVDVTRYYSSLGYEVPTQITVNIPLAISILSVTGLQDIASAPVTTNATDNVVTLNFGPTTAHLAGALAAINCRAEDGNTQTLYVSAQ